MSDAGARRLLLALVVASNGLALHGISPQARADAGEYAVGYRDLLLRDPSRPALSVDGTTPATETGRHGRQMHIALWYPAARGTGRAMTRAEYVARAGYRLDQSPLDRIRRQRAESTWFAAVARFNGDTATLRRMLPVLMRQPVHARSDARAAAGSHPLILFPEWQPPGANNILAEYLASHGFVVASVSTKGTFEEQLEYWSPRGLEAMVADLRFAIGALDTVRGVDTRRIGAMGVGISASGALALQMQTPTIRALVSLEGGITTESEMRLLRRTPHYELARIDVPLLAITAPHPSVDAARLDAYRHSDRLYAHFPRSGEFWFLDYGVLEATAPGIIGTAPTDVAAAHAWGSLLTRRFFEAHLQRDADALRWLGQEPSAMGAPNGLFTLTRRPAVPAPPSVAALKALHRSDGITGIERLAESRVSFDSTGIPLEYLVELDLWLGSGRDVSGRDRHRLAALRARLHPTSSRAQFALAGNALRQADTTTARRAYVEALRLAADDLDPHLDVATRARLIALSRAAIERLR